MATPVDYQGMAVRIRNAEGGSHGDAPFDRLHWATTTLADVITERLRREGRPEPEAIGAAVDLVTSANGRGARALERGDGPDHALARFLEGLGFSASARERASSGASAGVKITAGSGDAALDRAVLEVLAPFSLDSTFTAGGDHPTRWRVRPEGVRVWSAELRYAGMDVRIGDAAGASVSRELLDGMARHTEAVVDRLVPVRAEIGASARETMANVRQQIRARRGARERVREALADGAAAAGLGSKPDWTAVPPAQADRALAGVLRSLGLEASRLGAQAGVRITAGSGDRIVDLAVLSTVAPHARPAQFTVTAAGGARERWSVAASGVRSIPERGAVTRQRAAVAQL